MLHYETNAICSGVPSNLAATQLCVLFVVRIFFRHNNTLWHENELCDNMFKCQVSCKFFSAIDLKDSKRPPFRHKIRAVKIFIAFKSLTWAR